MTALGAVWPQLHEADLLDAWDRAAGVPTPVRGVILLSVALQDRSPTELLELSIGQRDRLLIEMLAASFSPVIDGLVDCTDCGQPIEVAIGCAQLLSADPAKPAVPLERDGWRIEWRPPNSSDLLAARAAVDEKAAEQVILRRCVLATTGIDADIDAGMCAELSRAIDESDPLGDIQVELNCPDCGRQQQTSLDVADFLWCEVEGRAATLLRDVASLARTYGWTESDVLALSPVRRQAYLELANG